MDTILDALQEGRLFELPQNDKAHALQFLAHVIEAFPDVPAESDVVGLVLKREEATNTAIGKGWACPHARVSYDADLMCVMGWSPQGIDYGAPDGKPVALVVMYLVSENQRNRYLREISMLAKALETYPGLQELSAAQNLDDVRGYLLNLIDATKGAVGPDARGKMIRLKTRPTPETLAFRDLSNLVLEPLTLITDASTKPIALTQNAGLAEWLDKATDVIEKLKTVGVYQNGDWRVLLRSSVTYQGGRVAYDCLAVQILPVPATQPK